MADLFRKSALEKLSSPEQLDKAVVITPPSFWIALGGGLLIIAGALLWGIFGRLPINVEASGIFVNGDGTSSVYTEVSGVITEISAETGSKIKKGDVIAYVSDGDITTEIENLSSRIAAVEKVTMDSEDDAVTADNKSLVDLKTELITLTTTYNQTKTALEQKEKQKTEQEEVVAGLKKEADNAKASYYDSMGGVDSQAQLNYSEAQGELSMRQQYYESAYSSMQQAGTAVTQAQLTHESCFTEYQNAVTSTNNAYARYQALLGQAGLNENIPDSGDSFSSGETVVMESAVSEQEIQAAMEAYQQEYTNMVTAETSWKQAEIALSSAQAAYQTAVDALANSEANLNTAKADFNSAKSAYTAALNGQQAQSSSQNKLSNEYSQALSEYNTEKSVLESLEQTIDSLKNEMSQAKENVTVQKKKMDASFSSAKESILDQLNTELEKYTKNLKKYEILSTQEGVVQEIVAVQGMVVGQGSEILKVKQGETGRQEVLCYMPVNTGKKVVPGMEIMIYPTTVNEQEYGHMSGTVKEVADYVTSQAEMKKRLGDETLVNAFLQSGPVVEVVCTIREDSSTQSGYYWSSKKGKDITLTEGTMLQAKIVTEEKAPITMLLPYLKEKMANIAKPAAKNADSANAGS